MMRSPIKIIVVVVVIVARITHSPELKFDFTFVSIKFTVAERATEKEGRLNEFDQTLRQNSNAQMHTMDENPFDESLKL